MWRLLLFFAVLTRVRCGCDYGYDLVKDGECRGLEDIVAVFDDQAMITVLAKCGHVKGKPVIIHDQEHQSYWQARAPPKKEKSYLMLGIVCNAQSKRYEWADGSKIDFKPSAGYDSYLDRDCRSDYTWFIRPDGTWGYGGPGNMEEAYIYCTTQLEQPVRSPEGCDGFGDDSDDGVCYQVSKFAAANWQQAQLSCMELEANLASIHNLQENSFIRRTAVSNGATYGVFIGASIQKDGSLAWADGSPMDYTNFYPDFPQPGLGECIVMDTSKSSGQWMSVDCAARYPAACVRDQRPVAEPTCISEGYKENTHIASPGFPFDASTPCDYLLTVAPGHKVQVNILSLEANSCCDRLIIYDGAEGGKVLGNITGSISGITFATRSSNTMRVSWQPQGGVNVMGFTMIYGEI